VTGHDDPASGHQDADPLAQVTSELRRILAAITKDDRPLHASAGTPLLRDGIGLDSLGGTVLLTEVQRRFGVDVADQDLNLESLATLGTLAAFIVTARPASTGRS
jgi:acyl carrier protein